MAKNIDELEISNDIVPDASEVLVPTGVSAEPVTPLDLLPAPPAAEEKAEALAAAPPPAAALPAAPVEENAAGLEDGDPLLQAPSAPLGIRHSEQVRQRKKKQPGRHEVVLS